MYPPGDLVVVLGQYSSQISEVLTQLAVSVHDPLRNYWVMASAKMPKEEHRFIIDPMIDGKMSLKGYAKTIEGLIDNHLNVEASKKRVRLIIHDAEAFHSQDDAYDILLALRKKGYDIYIGGKERYLLIEKLALDAQAINPEHVVLVRTPIHCKECCP